MITSSDDKTYDAIVIGSGMGGLATASILASVGKQRVLVLESHFKLGGFLHSFKRKKWVWDPGLHYVGEMHNGSMARQCMDLVTGGTVAWHKMGSPFEKFIFPEGTFTVPDCPKKYRDQLIGQFPAEASNIKRYFRMVHSIRSWSQRWFFAKQFSNPLAARMMGAGRGPALKNTHEVLDALFDDELLKAILLAQWPDYGTEPEKSAFGFQAIVAGDFENGAYYPVGGSERIVEGAINVIECYGGKCVTNHAVERIVIKEGRACGVVVRNKGKTSEYSSHRVISSAGVEKTLRSLVTRKYCVRERERLDRIEPGPSANILFLGLNDDPRKAGFEDCNYWLYRHAKHRYPPKSYAAVLPELDGCYVGFSLRQPGKKYHTAQIITLDNHQRWSQFADSQWMRRSDEYEDAKSIWADSLLDFVEERLPGLRQLVEYRELSSPLTVNSILGHPRGQVYGRACVRERLEADSWGIGTSVRGLYLTGTDIVLPGVNAALMIGVMTAGKILGWTGMPRILLKAFRQKKESRRRDELT